MKKIILTNGFHTKVDDDDYDKLIKFNWWDHKDGYAYRQVSSGRAKTSRGKVVTVLMHRLITNAPMGKDVDHKNMDRLDNRKINLRIVDRTQNNFNTGVHKNNKSGFRGISWNKRIKSWRVYIGGTKNRIELGHYKTIKEAVLARKKAEDKIICE